MQKLYLNVLIIVAVFFGWNYFDSGQQYDDPSNPVVTALSDAFQNRRSNFQIEGEGEVLRVLSDDIDGSRHQRFILELVSGQTLLVAHNIDLAPRISTIKEGDLVSFNGEYEWNPQGGVIHWTHHDPRGIHATGWLRHKGRIYQ
ncbi:MAG: DUF3465 domain-containing protein [Gammaproteobacteria bacterium]|nr:DUF3465 domain-containing protein [Gammaproteobacteria bacterium]